MSRTESNLNFYQWEIIVEIHILIMLTNLSITIRLINLIFKGNLIE